jgi:hypothetical protein
MLALAEPFDQTAGDGPPDGGRGAALAVAISAAFGPIGIVAAVVIATTMYKGGPGAMINDLNYYLRDFKAGLGDVVRGYTEGYVGTEVKNFEEGMKENPGETLVSYGVYPEHVMFGYASNAAWNAVQKPVSVIDKVRNYFEGPAKEGHAGRTDGRLVGELVPFFIPGSRLPRVIEAAPALKVTNLSIPVKAAITGAKEFFSEGFAIPRIANAVKSGISYGAVKGAVDSAIGSMLSAPVKGIEAAAIAVRRFAVTVRGSEAVKSSVSASEVKQTQTAAQAVSNAKPISTGAAASPTCSTAGSRSCSAARSK